MDPDAALKQIREDMEEAKNTHLRRFDREILMWEALYRFKELDEWLKYGGFLPEDWKPKKA